MSKAVWIAAALATTCAVALLASRSMRATLYAAMRPARTLEDVCHEYGARVDAQLAPLFAKAQCAYPPQRIALLAFKAERSLELWSLDDVPRFVHAWPVLAASGGPGPKLCEGDRQVPEGVYALASLNPNSRFHLSLEVGYPNAFDLAHAREEARAPGGEIFIHGSDRSVGCLAIGDEAIEELFVLATHVGIENVTIVCAPNDPRAGATLLAPQTPPPWLGELHAQLATKLAEFTH